METRKLKEPFKIDIYQDEASDWRWRILHKNNKVVGASSEGFESKEGCLKNLKLLSLDLSKYIQTIPE